MAQLVEGDAVQPGGLEREVEALAQLGGVEDVTGQRVREDEVVVGAPVGALKWRSSSRARRSAIGTERP